MPTSEATAGFSRLDDKGRMPITKAVRDALDLQPGSTVAWVTLGQGFMVIPQDAHLTQVMEDATSTLEHAGITVDALLQGLDEARDEVVREHYGESYFETLRTRAGRTSTDSATD